MQAKDIDKIKAIFLNKVDGLEWYYFNINLNTTLEEESSTAASATAKMAKAGVAPSETPGKTADSEALLSIDDSLQFLDQIEMDLDRFVYRGDAHNSMRNILRSLLTFSRKQPSILREVARRIYDLNDIPNKSKAHEGQLGIFNSRDNLRRNKRFYEKMLDTNFRANPQNATIVAEGDSWFQYPSFYMGFDPVKDVVNWLMEYDNLAVYSMASGGDWLSNILYTGEYIEALPRIAPDVLLISGGGNDMVGDMRLATMVRSPLLQGPRDLSPKAEDDVHDIEKPFRELLLQRKAMPHIDHEQYSRGLVLLSDEFFEFLNLAMTQYFLFFYNLSNSRRYKKMLIITQGYDFVQPARVPASPRGFVQRILNSVLKNGQRLHNPLTIKGITDPDDQRAVLYAMITEFNEMLIQLATYKGFTNVFHIDCRGLADPSDWFDELHLKGETNRLVAATFAKCINENLRLHNTPPLPPTKVYKVVDKIKG